MIGKISREEISRARKKDRWLNLPLPTLVEGEDAAGAKFQEKTVLTYISSEGASFDLSKTPQQGAPLKLTIDLPPKLSENKKLKLVLKGRVVSLETPSRTKSPGRVYIRLDTRYIITDEES